MVAGASIFLLSCSKDEMKVSNVSSEQKQLVTEFTATWCHVCGENGLPKTKELEAKYPSKVIVIAAHSDNSFGINATNVATDMSTFYGVTGIPSFAVGATESQYSYNSVESDVNTFFSSNTIASAGIGISKSIDGTTMTISTKTFFFKESTGKYNLAVYVTENGVSYEQHRDTAPTIYTEVHNNILRGSANGTWGVEIVPSTASKNQEIDGSYTFQIPSSVKSNDNLHVVAVIFKMVGGSPESVLNVNAL